MKTEDSARAVFQASYQRISEAPSKGRKKDGAQGKGQKKSGELKFDGVELPVHEKLRLLASLAEVDRKVLQERSPDIATGLHGLRHLTADSRNGGWAIHRLAASFKTSSLVSGLSGLPEGIGGLAEFIPSIEKELLGVDYDTFPFGYLHLERLEFTPTGFDCEETPLYSLVLAPGEEVTLSQKNWTKTKSEFTRLVANEVEESITTNSTQTSELTESTNTQMKFEMGMSSSFQGSGTIGVVRLSGSAQSDFNTSLQRTAVESVNQSMIATKQASLRSKEEHKTTFSISRDVGFEYESIRKLKNENPAHPVLYNYYRYLREWTVKVKRYDVRLTGDIMIPYPGEYLLGNFRRRQQLLAIINRPYECSVDLETFDEDNPPAGFPPKPEPYTREVVRNRKITAGYYGLDNDEPHTITVREGYEAEKLVLEITEKARGTPNIKFKDTNSRTNRRVEGRTGTFTVKVHEGLTLHEAWAKYSITLHARPTADTLYRWRTEGIQEICKLEAVEREAERQTALEEYNQLEELEQSMSTFELRQEEREEIYKKVVSKFLGGLVPVDRAPALMVRFIHEAFEFENVSFFLYPYFWEEDLLKPIDPASGMPTALAIDHPDLTRKSFLRSGYARVLVPIRPGYERKVLNFYYNGDPDELELDDSIRSVAQQVQDAHSNTYGYKALDNDCMVEQQTNTVACWLEYTPTDAVTMAATVISTPAIDVYRGAAIKAENEIAMRKHKILAAVEKGLNAVDFSKVTEVQLSDDVTSFKLE